MSVCLSVCIGVHTFHPSLAFELPGEFTVRTIEQNWGQDRILQCVCVRVRVRVRAPNAKEDKPRERKTTQPSHGIES